jgi:hypothetical protein
MSRPADATVRQASPADQWVSRAAAVTVTALAGLAGAMPGSPGALLLRSPQNRT